MKCYKYILDLTKFLNNFGEIIMTILIILFLINMIIYFILGNKKIEDSLEMILQSNWKNKSEKQNSKDIKNKIEDENNIGS